MSKKQFQNIIMENDDDQKNPHKAFIKLLKKQVSSTTITDNTSEEHNNTCSEEIIKELEAKFNELFGSIDSDDEDQGGQNA